MSYDTLAPYYRWLEGFTFGGVLQRARCAGLRWWKGESPRRVLLLGDGDGRFLREARAAAALQHERIVRVFDVGLSDSGNPFLVMELVKGRTVSELLKDDGPLAAKEAASLVQEIAAAPAPLTTICTSDIFFSVSSIAFFKAAAEIIAVPC